VLAALPVVLALAVYYRDQLAGAPLPRLQGDATLYGYQLMRAAECHGQWWRIAEDTRLGHPYPTQLAKHPGLYEGIDLMLLAWLTGGAFGATGTYHLAVLAALVLNGWVAAWIVMRLTRSVVWASAAVTLITLNQSVSARILGHLHLFKFSWSLIAVWAFVGFLGRPTWRRGLFLGITVALVLQGSFYLGYFTILGLGTWYLSEILRRRAPRGHRGAAVVAMIAFILVGGALIFPVWLGKSPIVATDTYFQRGWHETWVYSSELWKYLVPQGSGLAHRYFRDVRLRASDPLMDEGWNFPGYTVLVALMVTAVRHMRGVAIDAKVRPFVRAGLGLMAVWFLLSLFGGPGALLYFVAPSFRCYGRSGLLVVGLGSIVAPVVLSEWVCTRRSRLLRSALTLGVLGLVAYDARLAGGCFPGWEPESKPPAWVAWLRRQPRDVRLTAFAPPENQPFDWWGLRSVEWLPLHGHATLNGSEFALFEGDLRLLGASYEQMSPAGLQFVASLGYEAMAFHRDYLAKNSWIASHPWLERIARRDEWLICRASPRMPRLPQRSLDQVLGQDRNAPETREAPPSCWITGSWPLDQDVVVSGSEWALLAWSDVQGRLLSRPRPALYQHILGPGIPAYSMRTPAQPGSYHLMVLDRRLRPRAKIACRIIPSVPVAQPMFPARRPDLTVHPIVIQPAVSDGQVASVGLMLVNTSRYYAQSMVFREHIRGAAQTHPGLRSDWTKADAGALVLRIAPIGVDPAESTREREIPLPQDLPPGGRLKLVLRSDRLPSSWATLPLKVEPAFASVGELEVPAQTADLQIREEPHSADVAGSRPTIESPTH
jgi:hypothetical protein